MWPCAHLDGVDRPVLQAPGPPNAEVRAPVPCQLRRPHNRRKAVKAPLTDRAPGATLRTSSHSWELVMGLLNEVIGAVVAEEALDKVDPQAGLLKKGMAVFAGFEGEKVVEEKIEQHEEPTPPADSNS